jgi:hypothetical protein
LQSGDGRGTVGYGEGFEVNEVVVVVKEEDDDTQRHVRALGFEIMLSIVTIYFELHVLDTSRSDQTQHMSSRPHFPNNTIKLSGN